jgi:hypothetical protein
MREQLQQLAACGRPWAVSRAEMALAINDQYNGGGLSQSEYQELVQDLVRADLLNKEADDVDLKNMLVAAVMAISMVA